MADLKTETESKSPTATRKRGTSNDAKLKTASPSIDRPPTTTTPSLAASNRTEAVSGQEHAPGDASKVINASNAGNASSSQAKPPAQPTKKSATKRAGLVRKAAPQHFDEQLGELPQGYGEDSVVLMSRDPHSLYLYWDFSSATIERALSWMPQARTRLRLYEGDRLASETDFSLQAKNWRFHGLAPDRVYHAELMAVAQDGQVRRIGPPSNRLRMPARGRSSVRDDRFVRLRHDQPWQPSHASASAAHGASRAASRGASHAKPHGAPGGHAPVHGQAPGHGHAQSGKRWIAPFWATNTTVSAQPAQPAKAANSRQASEPVRPSWGMPASKWAPGLLATANQQPRNVEPPPLCETAREQIFTMSGGKSLPLGSS